MRDLLGAIGVIAGIVGWTTPALANDKPMFAPAPAWIKPAPAVDTAKLGDGSPVLLLFDTQQRLADGQVWSYVDTARRVASTEVLGAIGTVQLPWQPAQGDLIIHRFEIVRGTQHIDLSKGDKTFTVLRREEGIDNRSLDGLLTATVPVEGLRVGDVLRLSFSITRRDPTLKGGMQTITPVVFDPLRVQFARTRFVWPTKEAVHWRAYDDRLKIEPVVADGVSDLTIALPLAKPDEMPGDAPPRYQPLPFVEASSFADWAAVSAVMAPLYRTEGLIAANSPLAAEVARIKAAEADPVKRAALALQLVQDQIRYQMLGMDTGNYVPQTPAATWTSRYGDCKAKTLLLLAMLRDMGIEAEPVLANSKLGDVLPKRLPAPAAFDHVFVRASIGGETLWLDGTMAGDRYADIRDTPGLSYVLPVRASGATLLPIVPHPDARPVTAATIDLDERAGLELPAPYKIGVTVRGPAIGYFRVATAQGSKDDLDTLAENIIKPFMSSGTMASHTLSFDDAAGTATLTASGVAYTDWSRKDGRLETQLDSLVAGLAFTPDRARVAWRDIPVSVGQPDHSFVTTTIHLPASSGGNGFTLTSAEPLSATFGGIRVDRKINRVADTLTIETRIRNAGGEIPAAMVPDVRKQLALAKARGPRALAPVDYPAHWQDVQNGLRAHRFYAALAAYRKRIEDHPEKADRYTDRAWFYGRLFDRKAALADLTKAIAIAPDVDTYLRRATLRTELGDSIGALADTQAARDLDPSSGPALRQAAALIADRGDTPAALALLQERIDAGGDDKTEFLGAKAEIEARAGDKVAALESGDAAVLQGAGRPDALNTRCWVKAALDTALDTALKDCTKAIELSDSPEAALDSRALVYFRLKRYDDASADLDAVLAREPDLAASLYLRGVLRKQTGKGPAADIDLAAARFIAPRIDETYRKFGITP